MKRLTCRCFKTKPFVCMWSSSQRRLNKDEHRSLKLFQRNKNTDHTSLSWKSLRVLWAVFIQQKTGSIKKHMIRKETLTSSLVHFHFFLLSCSEVYSDQISFCDKNILVHHKIMWKSSSQIKTFGSHCIKCPQCGLFPIYSGLQVNWPGLYNIFKIINT